MKQSLLVSALAAALAAPGVLVAQQPTPPTVPAEPPSLPAQPPRDTTDTLVTREAPGEVEQGNVLVAVKSAGNFSTFVRAVEAAGLTETLQGEGPYTIFAPTDEAFAKLPAGQLDSLLQNPTELRTLLLGHVVPSKVTAADAATQSSATTVAGGSLAIAAKEGGFTVNGANVVKADLPASNGVIHAVDAVILPSAAPATPPPAADASVPSETKPSEVKPEPASPIEPSPAPALPEPSKSEPKSPPTVPPTR